jgi:hypothetical protein
VTNDEPYLITTNALAFAMENERGFPLGFITTETGEQVLGIALSDGRVLCICDGGYIKVDGTHVTIRNGMFMTTNPRDVRALGD